MATRAGTNQTLENRSQQFFKSYVGTARLGTAEELCIGVMLVSVGSPVAGTRSLFHVARMRHIRMEHCMYLTVSWTTEHG